MATGIWSFEAALISFIVSSLIGSKLIPYLVKVAQMQQKKIEPCVYLFQTYIIN